MNKQLKRKFVPGEILVQLKGTKLPKDFSIWHEDGDTQYIVYKYNPTKQMNKELYEIVDAFLVEAKNQHGEERSVEALNKDRHLAVKGLEKLFKEKLEQQKKDILEEVESHLFSSDTLCSLDLERGRLSIKYQEVMDLYLEDQSARLKKWEEIKNKWNNN